jgi:hypothetical protein
MAADIELGVEFALVQIDEPISGWWWVGKGSMWLQDN